MVDSPLQYFEPAGLANLSRSEVHVWLIGLDAFPSNFAVLRNHLSPDEALRAERFKFDLDRNRYIIAHGELRRILGSYLSTRPSDLIFVCNAHGKPEVVRTGASKDLRFNLSHSGGAALIAVTEGRRIGIDLEFIDREFDCMEIASRFFATAEIEQLRLVPADQQRRAFFNCWTRKEAYVKAQGMGLQLSLKEFEVSLVPDVPAALVRTAPAASEAGRWRLQEIPLGQDYVGALAVKGHCWQLRCLRRTNR